MTNRRSIRAIPEKGVRKQERYVKQTIYLEYIKICMSQRETAG